MLKPHRDAILSDAKGYCSYRNSQATLVTEGALERLKIKFRALFRKCNSNKETLKLYVLACVVLHNFCIELGDLVPRKFDLNSDHASNRRLSPGEGMDILVLGSTNQKNFEVNKKSQKLFFDSCDYSDRTCFILRVLKNCSSQLKLLNYFFL